MSAILKDRVQQRLDTLKLNPTEAARRMGFNGAKKGFVNDILIDRKKSVRGPNLLSLSRALECDPEYLLGEQEMPRRPRRAIDGNEQSTVKVGGVIEVGTWREVTSKTPQEEFFPATPDPHYPAKEQRIYHVNGNGADQIGLLHGDEVLVVSQKASGSIVAGSVVVTRRTRSGGKEYEIGARLVVIRDGKFYLVRQSSEFTDDPIPYPSMDVAILGIALRLIRDFGLVSRA